MAFTSVSYVQSTTMFTGSGTSPSSDIGMPSYDLDSVKTSESGSRKRRKSSQMGSDFDEDTPDDRSVRTNDDQKKQNHSEIEKRRRDKMNTYISELSAIVPMCHAMPRKLDKLTVLRMAVQHMKTIRGAVHSYTEGHYKPAFLSDEELKMLILQAADGFIFVVGCDRGRILYVSESVSKTLNYVMDELLGQSWFDILHPKDVAKVKEQLSSSDLSPRERLIDAKTMLPVKTDVPCGATRLCPGARRSFFCRMKCKSLNSSIIEDTESQSSIHRRKKQDRKYLVIQCTGYLKSWIPAKIGQDDSEGDGDGDSSGLSCLVAVGRLQPPICSVSPIASANVLNIRTIQFISRHTMDGKFLFVDQRSTLVLGFLPQELLGTSVYEYYHPEDIPLLAETHRLSLLNTDIIKTAPYRLRTKEGKFVNLQSEWKSFRNPWTKEVEYLIAKNSLIAPEINQYPNNTLNNQPPSTFDFNQFNQPNGQEIQKFINTQVESSKIGSQVAEEVLESQLISNISTGEIPDTVNPETAFYNDNIAPEIPQNAAPIVSNASPIDQSIPVIVENPNNEVNDALPNFDQIYNDTNTVVPAKNKTIDEEVMEIIGSVSIQKTANGNTQNGGNDEAAMAVIMSLLEADAGLGGPVDFAGLPWPLP